MNKISYWEAENALRAGKKVAAELWPSGRVAYHDVDGDGVPDVLDTSDPDFLRKAQWSYEKFKSNIRIAENGQVIPGAFITHGDTLQSWFIVE
jgi:hypothetical protein